MKKIIIAFVIVISLVLPFLAKAQDNSAQIKYLQEQIAFIITQIIELQKQLLALMLAEGQVPAVSPAPSPTPSVVPTELLLPTITPTPTPIVKAVAVPLSGTCQVWAKEWVKPDIQQIISHIGALDPDSIYYNVFIGEHMPLPTEQLIHFQSAFKKLCESSVEVKQDFLDKEMALSKKYGFKIDDGTALMLLGWQDYI